MEMLLLGLNPDRPYVAFVPQRELAWWEYELRRASRTGGTRIGWTRRLLGHALIRAGRAVAAERQVTAIG